MIQCISLDVLCAQQNGRAHVTWCLAEEGPAHEIYAAAGQRSSRRERFLKNAHTNAVTSTLAAAEREIGTHLAPVKDPASRSSARRAAIHQMTRGTPVRRIAAAGRLGKCQALTIWGWTDCSLPVRLHQTAVPADLQIAE